DISQITFADGLSIYDHDAVFWFGDLNYRLKVENSEWNGDQLREQQSNGQVFVGFQEPDILPFRPTYKYDVGTSTWDSSEKARVPAWCDRILWWTRDPETRLKVSHYESADWVIISDHKPVRAAFKLGVRKIDQEKADKLYDEAIREADRKANELLPQVSLSMTEVLMQLVKPALLRAFFRPFFGHVKIEGGFGNTSVAISANNVTVPSKSRFAHLLSVVNHAKRLSHGIVTNAVQTRDFISTRRHSTSVAGQHSALKASGYCSVMTAQAKGCPTSALTLKKCFNSSSAFSAQQSKSAKGCPTSALTLKKCFNSSSAFSAQSKSLWFLVDFGEVHFLEPSTHVITINNTGKSTVRFKFIVRPERGICAKWLQITPPHYVIPVGQSTQDDGPTDSDEFCPPNIPREVYRLVCALQLLATKMDLNDVANNSTFIIVRNALEHDFPKDLTQLDVPPVALYSALMRLIDTLKEPLIPSSQLREIRVASNDPTASAGGMGGCAIQGWRSADNRTTSGTTSGSIAQLVCI
ncbi:hypothetical protein TELCIR_13305, partial [Teladorsagia circumcincta]